MWIFADIGFFSIVKKPDDVAQDTLTVRARVRADLVRMKELMPDAGEIKTHTGTDYPYRMTVDSAAFAAWLAYKAKTINYSNFKNRVAQTQGMERERVYERVWTAMFQLGRLKE